MILDFGHGYQTTALGPHTAAHPYGINDLAGQVFLQVTWGF
jgi:hypothetical protein